MGDGVELHGDRWVAVLVTDEVPVSLAGRSDTLSGLRWTTTSGTAPVDTGRFMRHQEFADFVNPPAGSGCEGG